MAFRERIESPSEEGLGSGCNPFAAETFSSSMQVESGLSSPAPRSALGVGQTPPGPPVAPTSAWPSDLGELVQAVALAVFKVQSAGTRGEEVRFFLRPDVLSGSEVRVAVAAHRVEVVVIPANLQVEALTIAHQSQLEARLKAQLSGSAVQVEIVRSGGRKRGNNSRGAY